MKNITLFTVHSVEYAFGAHDYATSGVFEIEPRQCPGFRFRKSIFMGTTTLDPIQVREFMERMSSNYNGDTYHLIVKNCNHFCEDICYRLTGNRIPRWVNRLAKIGIASTSFFSCCLVWSVLRTRLVWRMTSSRVIIMNYKGQRKNIKGIILLELDIIS